MVKVGEPGALTVKVAEAAAPVPLLVELTCPVVLTFAPIVVLVTLTEITQLAPAAPVAPPVSEIRVSPCALPGDTVPPQVLLNAGVLATDMPAGKGSTTARPARDTGLPAGLLMVRVSVDVPPAVMLAGVNAFVITGE